MFKCLVLSESEANILERLLENQIKLEDKLKGTPEDIYESEILTPPWNTSELRDLKKRIEEQK